MVVTLVTEKIEIRYYTAQAVLRYGMNVYDLATYRHTPLTLENNASGDVDVVVGIRVFVRGSDLVSREVTDGTPTSTVSIASGTTGEFTLTNVWTPTAKYKLKKNDMIYVGTYVKFGSGTWIRYGYWATEYLEYGLRIPELTWIIHYRIARSYIGAPTNKTYCALYCGFGGERTTRINPFIYEWKDAHYRRRERVDEMLELQRMGYSRSKLLGLGYGDVLGQVSVYNDDETWDSRGYERPPRFVREQHGWS